MNDHLKIVIKREELYERIWQTPAKQLAKEYQVSDTRLAVICQKLKTPLSRCFILSKSPTATPPLFNDNSAGVRSCQ